MSTLFSKLIESENDISFSKRLDIATPINGKVKSLDLYPSLLFKERLYGEGVVVEPSGYQIVSPFDGSIEQLPPTAEQIRVKSKQGIKLQIQLGVNTETMMGFGFKLLCKQGDTVEKGQPILNFDLRKIKERIDSSLCAITILNSDKVKGVMPNYRQVRINEDILLSLYV